jgi:hypothetical protein
MKSVWQQTKFPVLCFLTAMLLALIGEVVSEVFDATWLTVLFWSLAVTPFAITFYRLRGTNRLMYGVFELLVAFTSLYAGIWRLMRAAYPFSFEQFATVSLLLWVAIYFMVRALDNIGLGLKPGSNIYARWQMVFPRPPANPAAKPPVEALGR